MTGKIAAFITHVKFYVNRFRGYGAVTPRNLGISIGMADGSYNSALTAMLHCDSMSIRNITDSESVTLVARCHCGEAV